MALMLQSLFGLLIIPLLAWALSADRKATSLPAAARIAFTGIAIQFIIAGLFTLIPQLSILFTWAAAAVSALQAATGEGMKFLFGYLAGGPAPFTVTDPSKGFVLALQALPLVVIMSVLAKLLYHWGILQRVVALLASALQRTMGVSGPVGTAAAANIFIGMVEAPIFIRPWLARLDKGGLFAVMTTGMATVAGTVMALYASFLEPVLPGAAGHILLASIMSAPAALVISRLMVPWQTRTVRRQLARPAAAARNRLRHGCHCDRHHRRHPAGGFHRRHAAGHGGAGRAGQHDARRDHRADGLTP
jgi:CNT family concentrative nucleoside transporter